MNKYSLKKWTIALLTGVLFGSCVNKDYDFDKYDDSAVLKDMTLGFPLCYVGYSMMEIAKKANFNQELVAEGDTIFLIYNTTLDFSSESGNESTEKEYISIFDDVTPEGSVLYFSNPILNCTVENNDTKDLEFKINYVAGTKDGCADTYADFDGNGSKSTSFTIPPNQTVTQRFDRTKGATNKVFDIGEPNTGVGPDTLVYSYAHNSLDNDRVKAKIKAKLPLSFDAGSILVLKDTIPVNLTSYENIESVILRLSYISKLPVGGEIDFIFLDADTAVIKNIKQRKLNLGRADITATKMQGVPNFTMYVSLKEKTSLFDIKFEKVEYDAVEKVEFLLLKTTLGNPNENIHLKPDDFLKLKMDLFLKGDVKL